MPTRPSAPSLRPRQYAILTSVQINPDISQTGLVEQTGVDRSTLADIVRRLVKKGLLQRKRTRRDARMYAVRLTAKGKSALGSVRPIAAKVDQRILSVLRADQRGDFIEALGEIVKAMSSQRRSDLAAKALLRLGGKPGRRSSGYRPNAGPARMSGARRRTGAWR